MKQARNAFCVPPVRLDRHGLQSALHLPGFHQHDLQSRLGQPSVQPLRQGPCFKANGGDGVLSFPDPARPRFRLAGSLRLHHELSMFADHADSGLFQRYIQSSKQLHPAILRLDPIRNGDSLPLILQAVTGGARRRPRHRISGLRIGGGPAWRPFPRCRAAGPVRSPYRPNQCGPRPPCARPRRRCLQQFAAGVPAPHPGRKFCSTTASMETWLEVLLTWGRVEIFSARMRRKSAMSRERTFIR
ncbi:hypothetical protein SAMN04244567_02646 [Paracoccus pantotrophus]|nr:hypothetical protein SAMN04244567_02646 [Paracoccus pantotrophus]